MKKAFGSLTQHLTLATCLPLSGGRGVRCLFILLAILAFLPLSGSQGVAADSTLVRLAFWVPPERMAEFEVDYREQVVPFLRQFGQVESSRKGRATPDSVFTRLFVTPLVSNLYSIPPTISWLHQGGLNRNTKWQKICRALGKTFGTHEPTGLIKWEWRRYDAPAGSGTMMQPEPGRGHWRTYDVADGLRSAYIRSLLQDRDGNLWCGTSGGVSRYDGQDWITLTTEDGLAGNSVWAICQDHEGTLWSWHC